MTTLVILGAVIGLLTLLAVLSPFFRGTGGFLQDAAAADSVDRLQLRRSAILRRWLEEERQHESGMITDREWSLRQVYLSGRYVDVTRRMDWLSALQVSDAGDRSASHMKGEI